ncbi:hypothetical protein DVH24_041122 [Malus domestica]|uniref:Uncharacterized protein n=1 Tax=Malus domestica TaxID=3750 RepID=A0A498ID44_MALDO|nr:hypothetical protein DVH24_041122 [Malus domestica]
MPKNLGEVFCGLRRSKGVLHIPLALLPHVLCLLGSLLAGVVVGGTDLHGSVGYDPPFVWFLHGGHSDGCWREYGGGGLLLLDGD